MKTEQESERESGSAHLFATGKINSDGFIVQSIRIQGDRGGWGVVVEGGPKRKRESVAC